MSKLMAVAVLGMAFLAVGCNCAHKDKEASDDVKKMSVESKGGCPASSCDKAAKAK